ncbi:MAG: dihydrodipicolinate synthase family protein [Fimbriimonadaceae bacterium]|nr:dihydrodipicolinate synthase family protein [Fimbriimonadaceae bacterium]
MTWQGVFPAITTPFAPDGSVDHDFLGRHAAWLVDNGCRGIVGLGSLGEGATLNGDEKRAILRTLVATVGERVPVIAGISALSTQDAIALAKDAKRAGCRGLMVLPAYVYPGVDWREARAHVEAIFRATDLSCMLYNNPISYGLDFRREQIAELCEIENLHAVKESSADVRRTTALKALLGDRLAVFMGVDDLIVEGVAAGATGWIAGLVNAFPDESVRMFDLARAGRFEDAFAIYRWFLPLLRLDVHPKLVQYIKLAQVEVGMGSETVRAPRLALVGQERATVLATIRHAIANRPTL